MKQSSYIIQRDPFTVPTTDGKIIKEHFGHASTPGSPLSIAHMVAPAGWSEPYQTPQFDEYTVILEGQKMIEIDDEQIILRAGESILIRKETRVRYSNPFKAPCTYLAICLPAFSMELVNRES